ncbi:DUF2637 domain-containing protein [Streptomyces erythrochromogenes]|uniref:DUF2637 domain-containing protein n=1 Tax=Streptomyces erythrochromogenes TaxID=285574 RepID=UPI002F909420|nr:DUF2637 domain-containing protein [Streptomyces erythrochromogenes]WSR88927.1 DUF2637 domain-containing protein [Streptomyces erythrochromogenes]
MSTYREERRADEAAARTADREDRRLELEAKLAHKRQLAEDERAEKERKAEQARKDGEVKRRQEQAEARRRQDEKARNRAARMARLGKVARWLNANPVTVFVGFVMSSSVIPAVISQVGALGDTGVNVLLAALLAAMLEGGAWAFTFMGKAAEDAGRPAAKYRIATWSTAFVAAAVNYWHWAEKLPQAQWVAIVFAASSLFAIYLWDMKTHGSHGRTKAERKEERARRSHLAKRKKDHKEIAQQAALLLSAMPYGEIDEETAFAAAWRIHKGAEPGLSPEVYAAATQAKVALGAAFELGEHVRPQMVRAGMLAGLYNPLNPLSRRPAPSVPTLEGPASAPALQGPTEGPTAQAGIGVYGTPIYRKKASESASEKAGGNAGGDAGGNTPRGRSAEELAQLLPEAHRLASELVAEGRQISAASLAKGLKIRREDGMWLRDRVIEERKLHLVQGA